MGDERYLYQIVFCSAARGKGRCFRRQITVYPTGSFVTGIEVLPPGYEHPMAMMRGPEEEIFRTADHPDSEGYACPFCGNPGLFYCACGVASCRDRRNPTHQCPRCGKPSRPVPARVSKMSESGLLEGGPGGRLECPGQAPVPPADPETQARRIAGNADLAQRLRALKGQDPPALLPADRKALPEPEMRDGFSESAGEKRVRLKKPKETWLERLAEKIAEKSGMRERTERYFAEKEAREKAEKDDRLRAFMKKKKS